MKALNFFLKSMISITLIMYIIINVAALTMVEEINITILMLWKQFIVALILGFIGSILSLLFFIIIRKKNNQAFGKFRENQNSQEKTMKIAEILEEKTIIYRLFSEHIYIPVIALTIFFYIFSYALDIFNLHCPKIFYDFLCKAKIEEFQKSDLKLNGQIESFVFISNLSVLILPVLFLIIISKNRIKKINISDSLRSSIAKSALGCLFFIILFLVCIYITPFSQNLWGGFFYYNEFVYFLSASFIFTITLSFELILFCYAKLFFQKNRDKN